VRKKSNRKPRRVDPHAHAVILSQASNVAASTDLKNKLLLDFQAGVLAFSQGYATVDNYFDIQLSNTITYFIGKFLIGYVDDENLIKAEHAILKVADVMTNTGLHYKQMNEFPEVTQEFLDALDASFSWCEAFLEVATEAQISRAKEEAAYMVLNRQKRLVKHEAKA